MFKRMDISISISSSTLFPLASCQQNLYDITISFLFININQLDALNFFIISLSQASTCFEHMCSSSGGQIVLYSLWYHHTYRWPSRAQIERVLSQSVLGIATYRCDDTRDCIIQFALLTMSTCARNM